jgi:FO synthase
VAGRATLGYRSRPTWRLPQSRARLAARTAAEILDDESAPCFAPTRSHAQWLEVHGDRAPRRLRSTSTIMYGHVEGPRHWARHLLRCASSKKTGGFTEFVPLPFVHMEAPIYLKGRARAGRTLPRGDPHARRCDGSRCTRSITKQSRPRG